MSLSKEKIEYFKDKLVEEKERLEKELERIGKKNPKVPGDWELKTEDLNVNLPDPNEQADVFEEIETRNAIEDNLEERLMLVNEALVRVKKGTYGICQISKEPIEEKRLEANPAARNCVKHATNS